jgi:hypothetical protein
MVSLYDVVAPSITDTPATRADQSDLERLAVRKHGQSGYEPALDEIDEFDLLTGGVQRLAQFQIHGE